MVLLYIYINIYLIVFAVKYKFNKQTKVKQVMKTKVKCKVVMLPTDNPNYSANNANQLGKYKNGTLLFCKGFDKEIESIYQPQHLYIVSNEKIKEGGYVYIGNIEENPFNSFVEIITDKSNINIANELGFKVIASTDKSLGLPLVSEDFIKAYCKVEGKIDDVMVEYNNDCPKTNSNNEISITKVKDNFTREEVVQCLTKILYHSSKNSYTSMNMREKSEFLNKWISDNL